MDNPNTLPWRRALRVGSWHWQEEWPGSSPVRYVLIIQSNVESGLKMIQFNIQFNIWFQIFIQFDYSFNALLQLFIQSNYSIQYSFWNIQFKILFKTLEKIMKKFYQGLRIGKNAKRPINRPWICGFSEVKLVEDMKLGKIVP